MFSGQVVHFLISLTGKLNENGNTTRYRKKRDQTGLGYDDRISLELRRNGINLN